MYSSRFLLFVACILICGCSIRPLYYVSPKDKLDASKSFVQVACITERLGQELRNLLLERLGYIQTQKAPITIGITLQTTKTGIGYNPDLSSTLERITLTATTTLYFKQLRKVFKTEKSDIVTIPFSIYASLVNEEDIKRKILREVANDIIQRITSMQKEFS